MKNIVHHYFINCLRTLIVLLCILAFTAGCDDFVEIDYPNSQLISATVFEDKNTATAALKDIYGKIRDTGLLTGKRTGISTLLGVYTDELLSYEVANNFGIAAFYNNSLNAQNSTIKDLWNMTYNQIYAANAVAEGVAKSASINADDKNQLIGEALFIRALLHSYLSAIYGKCPYIDTSDYRQNTSVYSLSTALVYEKCIIDLEQALELLSADYIGNDRTRANKAVAQALLARLYLYSERWEEASNAASAVLNYSSTYVLESDLDLEFTKSSSSTIWQLAAGGGFTNTQEGGTFIFNSGPPPSVALREDLYAAFEVGDKRREKWTRTISSGTTTWHHSYKYKEDISSNNATEFSVIMRLSEQYLIRSEARARQGYISGAQEDLNEVRSRAGLDDTTAGTANELLNAIIYERRFEFFTELGMRFFDLQRTGRLDSVLSPIKLGWNTTDQFWPLPQSELLLNPNVGPQNLGY